MKRGLKLVDGDLRDFIEWFSRREHPDEEGTETD